MVFYCTQGEHCTRGMHGVLNGAGSQTLKSYRDSITVNRDAVAPSTIGGGKMVANNVTNILSATAPGGAGSIGISVASIIVGLGSALLLAQ